MANLRPVSYAAATVICVSVGIISGCAPADDFQCNDPNDFDCDGVPNEMDDTPGTPNPGTTAGTTTATGSTTSGDGDGDGDLPCVEGIPATTQVPRMLNTQYDRVIAELLGVTGLQANGGQPPSAALIPDSKGSLNGYGWVGYLTTAENIASEVMSGENKTHFISCDPAAAGCLEDTIRSFGRKAFRRPVTDAEVASFMRLASVEPQGTPDEVAEAILFAFLASPSFIMLPELAQETEGSAIKLSPHEVATRLSFLIWGSLPDDVLNAAADSGQLATSEQILAQAQRMVQDKARLSPVMKEFHHFYAAMGGGSHWEFSEHDSAKFPEFTSASVEPLNQELEMFFDTIASNGGTFDDLLLSNIGFVNQDTAAIYGLNPADFGPELRQVDLPPMDRPGFLTRGAFLSSFSHYDATSPIQRGAYISQNVIGITVEPPPPGAEQTPLPEGDYKTERERVQALTSSDAVCNECHESNINPPGWVFEHYSAIGKVQIVDPLGGPIDGTGDVKFGRGDIRPITSPFELMSEMTNAVGPRRKYAEKWVSFATQRIPNENDNCIVNQLTNKLTTGGYRIVDLMVDLTQDDSFRLRTVGN